MFIAALLILIISLNWKKPTVCNQKMTKETVAYSYNDHSWQLKGNTCTMIKSQNHFAT